MKGKLLGREIKEEHVFNGRTDTFGNYYDAIRWLRGNGYSSGSTDCGLLVAIRKGEYDLPQKWKNFSQEERASVDGVIKSSDYRDGLVSVIIFKPNER